jgi:Na+/H+ antiporter NhaD/arsenite permease-like protein
MLEPNTTAVGVLMLALLFLAFAAMVKWDVPQSLALPILACAFLVIQGYRAENVLGDAFGHFSEIALLFTAVAIPAHMIDRSQGLQWVAAGFGRRFGAFTLRHPRLAAPILIGAVLLITSTLAALMHNVTAILIMTPIVIRLCGKYEVPSRWILCGLLVSSNLGGFSTRWGDTPNIIESKVWGLTNGDFLREVLPANLVVLLILIGVVLVLTRRSFKTQSSVASPTADHYGESLKIAHRACDYGKEQEYMTVDRRLLLIGLGGLTLFIVSQMLLPDMHIAIGAATIVLAVLLERSEDRLDTLKSLGYDVYLVFASVFTIASCVEHSWIGATLERAVWAAGASPWSIALTGYLGTMFTEAASWATAAAARIYPLNGSHTAAWSLGGGICAGSSSILTAASAGIILWEESRRQKNPKHVITFGRYLPFGVLFSFFMLLFYSVYFSLMRY